MHEIDAHPAEPALIARAGQGDQDAWAALVRAHQEPVFRLAYLILADAGEAEDVAQDVFVSAFRALHRFDPARPLRPWLLQIARNLAANRRRSVRRSLAALARWVQNEATIAAPTPTGNDASELREAVRKLSAPDQEILYVRYFLELSVAETAAVLNVAEGTVKSRLHRAVSRLRRIVERDYPALHEEAAQ